MAYYQTLKEEAQIYEKMTGKKCSIFPNNEEQDKKGLKFPSEIHRRRVMTIGDCQSKQHRYNMHSFMKQKKHKTQMTRNKHPKDLYSIILKQGIKMTITQQKTSFTSKNDYSRNKTSQITKKFSLNPQEQIKKIHKYINNQSSENKFNLQEKKIEVLQSNTASSPVIQNSQIVLIPIQPKRTKNETNFLSLNKKNILQSYKKTKHKITQQNISQATLGKSKKEKKQLEQRNKEQRLLQQELIKYHSQTKSFLDLMKQKYHLNFTKMKKYLGKIKRQTSIFESEDLQGDYLTKQALKFNQISEQVNHLNFHLKKNRKQLQALEESIYTNAFKQYFQSQEIKQSQQRLESIQEQNQNQESLHKKMSLIYRLKQSQANLRHQNEQKETQRLNQPNRLNNRVKQLQIHY